MRSLLKSYRNLTDISCGQPDEPYKTRRPEATTKESGRLVDRSPAMLRGIRIDMFWDGADLPAVSAPLGDFFGQGLGRCATFESALFSNPEGRSFNSYVMSRDQRRRDDK